MRPITQSQTAAGSTTAVPMDHYISPFNVGFGVVVSGTVNYTVQHTFSNIFDTAVTPTWFNHPVIAAQTTNQDGNYAFPVTAIRLTVNSGTGTATITLVQAGMTAP
jgi:archaellum component FlaF (FlaF/FlaG flagellin family)